MVIRSLYVSQILASSRLGFLGESERPVRSRCKRSQRLKNHPKSRFKFYKIVSELPRKLKMREKKLTRINNKNFKFGESSIITDRPVSAVVNLARFLFLSGSSGPGSWGIGQSEPHYWHEAHI